MKRERSWMFMDIATGNMVGESRSRREAEERFRGALRNYSKGVTEDVVLVSFDRHGHTVRVQTPEDLQ